MGEIIKKQVCKCEKCGNESEMTVTCKLDDHESGSSLPGDGRRSEQVKGAAACVHCGNEAEIWIDL